MNRRVVRIQENGWTGEGVVVCEEVRMQVQVLMTVPALSSACESRRSGTSDGRQQHGHPISTHNEAQPIMACCFPHLRL